MKKLLLTIVSAILLFSSLCSANSVINNVDVDANTSKQSGSASLYYSFNTNLPSSRWKLLGSVSNGESFFCDIQSLKYYEDGFMIWICFYNPKTERYTYEKLGFKEEIELYIVTYKFVKNINGQIIERFPTDILLDIGWLNIEPGTVYAAVFNKFRRR